METWQSAGGGWCLWSPSVVKTSPLCWMDRRRTGSMSFYKAPQGSGVNLYTTSGAGRCSIILTKTKNLLVWVEFGCWRASTRYQEIRAELSGGNPPLDFFSTLLRPLSLPCRDLLLHFFFSRRFCVSLRNSDVGHTGVLDEFLHPEKCFWFFLRLLVHTTIRSSLKFPGRHHSFLVTWCAGLGQYSAHLQHLF